MTGQIFSKIGWNYFIGSLMMLVVQFLCVYTAAMIDTELLSDENVKLLLSVLPIYLAGMPVMALMMTTVPKTAVPKRSMNAGQLAAAFFIAYALMFCGNILGNAVADIVGVLKGSRVNNVVAGAVGSANIFLVFVYVVICAPIAEELIFRKLLADRMIRFGEGTAIVASGLMFGLFHGNLNQFAYAFLVGMFFAFIYVKTGNIKYTIILHMLMNFVGSILPAVILRLSAGSSVTVSIYTFVMLGVMAVGIALIWINRKGFVLNKGEETINREMWFRTVICNRGMLLYSGLWLLMIIWQLSV